MAFNNHVTYSQWPRILKPTAVVCSAMECSAIGAPDTMEKARSGTFSVACGCTRGESPAAEAADISGVVTGSTPQEGPHS